MAAGRPVKAYLNEMPYCDTDSNPDFQTSVTSQALVACSLHDKNAETEFPPTEIEVSFAASTAHHRGVAAMAHCSAMTNVDHE